MLKIWFTLWNLSTNSFQGIDLGSGEPEWIVNKDRSRWDAIFDSLGPTKGKVSGSVAKKEMIKSRLPNPVLAKVWRLSDVDQDGALDSDEFALAMHLINIKLEGYDLPEDLPDHLIFPCFFVSVSAYSCHWSTEIKKYIFKKRCYKMN